MHSLELAPASYNWTVISTLHKEFTRLILKKKLILLYDDFNQTKQGFFHRRNMYFFPYFGAGQPSADQLQGMV